MLKLEDVRLEEYPVSTEIPQGWKIVGTFKCRRPPSPMNWNWFGRWDTPKHEIFHRLRLTEHGLTADELKTHFTEEADKAAVDDVIRRFSTSWDHRVTGLDFLTDDATGTRFRLIWRDPRVHYVKEVGLEGDFSQVPFEKPPKYLAEVPKLIEAAKNPPKPVEKAQKAPKAPKAPKAATAAAQGPSGDFLAKFTNVPVTIPGVNGANIKEVIDFAIVSFFEPSAMQVEKDDTTVAVKDGFLKILDRTGFGTIEGVMGFQNHELTEFVARYQKSGAIRTGFFRILKDLMDRYAEYLKTAPPEPPAASAPASAPEQPVHA